MVTQSPKSTSDGFYPIVNHQQYQSSKRSLMRKEKTNYNRLYFIYCQGDQGWLEISEHSALIYFHEIVKRFGLKNKFFADELSFYNRYTIGYLRIQNLDDVRYWLQKAELYQGEGQDSQHTFYFELTKTFPKPTLDHYLAIENERRLTEYSVAPAHNLAPEFYQLLIHLGRRLHHICNNRLDRLTCNTLGIRTITTLDHILISYHHLTYYKPSETKRLLAKWHIIREDLYDLAINIRTFSDFDLLDYEVCISLNEITERLIILAEKSITHLQNKRKATTAKTNQESSHAK
ncbi:hypothetical protein IKE82_00695 [Candidatus Saccharibacteria bacterium]|nr:hypothetical protein [Candidatus Saccharibacteria bacterium]